jgi:transcriptional regulator with PAS, ATPase and Fis domain
MQAGGEESERFSAPRWLEYVRLIRTCSSRTQIILVLDRGVTLDECCQAVREGVAGFIEGHPEQLEEKSLIRRLQQARQRFIDVVAESRSVYSPELGDMAGIVACSRAMGELLVNASRAAAVSDAPVLICGESGTGKQLLAELIHKLDPKRGDAPFVPVNCAALTGTLADSALFGHRKGAFTGALDDREGYFRAANGGTILLDEVGELDLALQPKLLRVMQEGLVLPVGSDRETPIDVRVIAATNRDLVRMVDEERFRLDLFQRLNVIALEIPPLRRRPEDIPPLFDFFLKKYGAYYQQGIRSVEPRVYQVLESRDFTGNVRELENVVRRMLAMKTRGDEITLSDLPEHLLADQGAGQGDNDHFGVPILPNDLLDNFTKLVATGRITLPELLEHCERAILSKALGQSNDTRAELAQRLGLSRRTFYNKCKKHRL